MRKPAAIASTFLLAFAATTFADRTYTFHEKLHPGQKITISEFSDTRKKYSWTTNGVADPTDTRTKYHWTITLTVLETRDGSVTKALAEVDPGSYSTTQDAGQDEKKTPCPFAGKSIHLTRLPDESFTNDFAGKADEEDQNILNNFLSPDEDFYPDKPVAVGDMWDNSDKLSKHSELSQGDQLLSECRLDWVKTIEGKPMAQITNSVATIYHLDDNVEQDVEGSSTILVDMNSQMIVKGDQKGTTKYSNPASDPSHITGGEEYTCHDEVIATQSASTTQPTVGLNR
jgi:hypothetical protein